MRPPPCGWSSKGAWTVPSGLLVVVVAGLAAGCAAYAWMLLGSAERAREAAGRRAWLRAQCGDPVFRDNMKHFSDACARMDDDDALDGVMAGAEALRAGLVGLAAFGLFMFLGPLLVVRRTRGSGRRARKEHTC